MQYEDRFQLPTLMQSNEEFVRQRRTARHRTAARGALGARTVLDRRLPAFVSRHRTEPAGDSGRGAADAHRLHGAAFTRSPRPRLQLDPACRSPA